MIRVAKIGEQEIDELDIICRSTTPTVALPQNGIDSRHRR
jgi:hypothetical protein